jgi:SH3-like domain-containing protein
VRAGDDEAAVLRFVVHAGTEVTFIQRRNAWVRIGLSDGQGGWVRAESLR